MSDAVMVPRVPDPNITAVIASMVRRMAIPTSIDPDALYFDNGHARKIYAAIVAASTPVGGWEPVAWRWRYKGTNWVYGNDLPVWASSDDCDEVIEPLYAAPTPPSVSIDNGPRPQEAVPTCDADGLADKLAKVRDLLRQIWEADSHLVWTGNPPEPSHDEEGECAKLANEAAGLITGIIGQPADGCSSNEGAGQ